MTADREWVKYGARWLARIDGTSGIARLLLLALTGFSTMGSFLKDYGFSTYFFPLSIGLVGGFVIFSVLYAEGGVWNQVKRDQSDMSKNFATPFQYISNLQTARAFYAGQVGRELTEEERDAIANELESAYSEMRDGIDIQ